MTEAALFVPALVVFSWSPTKPVKATVISTESIRIESSPGWLTTTPPQKSAPDAYAFDIAASPNLDEPRSGTIVIATTKDEKADVFVRQAGAKLTLFEQAQLIDPVPMAMEPGVAVKFMGKEIAEAPAVAQPFLIAAGEVVIVAAAAAAAAARSAFVTVPMPPPAGTPAGVPAVPLTLEFIAEEGALLAAYLPLAVAESE